MTVMADAIGYRRLRAPRTSGGVLIEPPLDAAAEMLTRAAERRTASSYDFQGKSLAELANLARGELVTAAANYSRIYRDVELPLDPTARILVAGHQPEIFHPGVWFKNFVLSTLGGQQQATAINLVIDSDTNKSTALRVPTGSVADPHTTTVHYDRGSPEIPHEERQILDRGLLDTFADRVSTTIAPLVANPLVNQYWPLVLERSKHISNLGECLAQARHRLEGQWGQNTLELPQSHVCKLEAFNWFTAHLLANLPRFWEIYNTAIADYRKINHVRSHAHPVPELTTDGEWLEAPYWVWTADDSQRRRLFVREHNDCLQLTDRQSIKFCLPITADSDACRAVEQLDQIGQQGIKLRTRALGTTLLARLLLGDAFVHGIGGAKYDHLTDVLIRRFFEVQPPEFFAISATLHLPVPREAVSQQEALQLAQRLRELEFHPERFIDPAANNSQAQLIHGIIAEKRRWIEAPTTIENARQRAQAIRAANESLQPWLQGEKQELIARRYELVGRLRGEAILNSREYSFCLYPEETLRQLMREADQVVSRRPN